MEVKKIIIRKDMMAGSRKVRITFVDKSIGFEEICLTHEQAQGLASAIQQGRFAYSEVPSEEGKEEEAR